METYQAQGFLPSFIAIAQDFRIKVPEGYSDEEADATLNRLATAWSSDKKVGGSSHQRRAAREQFDSSRPSVVVIQNETFSDLSDMNGLNAGYGGPQYFKNGINDALVRGDLYVSAFGGGTCNTEFSFLTGNSLAYVGAGKYPYTVYNFDQVQALPRQFRELGYRTSAIHPSKPTNWERDRVYPSMGFDDFYSQENDFLGAEVFHSGVSDEATYDKVMELLESSDEPQFVWDVTMQNHSGYDLGNIPQEDQVNVEPQGVGNAKANAQLNEYLSCIQKSDEQLQAFMDRLRQLSRPVVLVFYGDHQPSITPTYIDGIYPLDEPLVHTQRQYHTQYFVWANYDVSGNAQESDRQDTSVGYLAATTLELAGCELTPYQMAQLDCKESMPAINLFGYQDTAGTWHRLGEKSDPESDDASQAAFQAYQDLGVIQYREFAEKVQ